MTPLGVKKRGGRALVLQPFPHHYGSSIFTLVFPIPVCLIPVWHFREKFTFDQKPTCNVVRTMCHAVPRIAPWQWARLSNDLIHWIFFAVSWKKNTYLYPSTPSLTLKPEEQHVYLHNICGTFSMVLLGIIFNSQDLFYLFIVSFFSHNLLVWLDDVTARRSLILVTFG